MIGLLGRKVGMTQLFNEEGFPVPVTVLQVGPCVITQVRTKEKDGYTAVQLGFSDKKEKQSTKALIGHYKKAQSGPKRFLREIRTESTEGLEVGQELKVDQFEAGEFVDVEGISIGKGFQGVVKRHHFAGGPKTHGSMFGRVAGSIGASSFPSRVVKGMKMPGQMGNQRVTVQSLKVVKVDPENHLLVVKGPIPGAETGCVIIRTSLKRGKAKPWKVEAKEAEKAPPSPKEPLEPQSQKPQEPQPQATA